MFQAAQCNLNRFALAPQSAPRWLVDQNTNRQGNLLRGGKILQVWLTTTRIRYPLKIIAYKSFSIHVIKYFKIGSQIYSEFVGLERLVYFNRNIRYT